MQGTFETSITLSEESPIGICPPVHPGRSIRLNNLANAIQVRFEQKGDIEDIDKAIILNEESLTLRPPGYHLRPSSLDHFGITVLTSIQEDYGIEC